MTPPSRLIVSFVPHGVVLKAIVGGLSSLDEALDVIDQIAIEAASTGLSRVLIVVKLVDSRLEPMEYARMAGHASHRLQDMRCAILAGTRRRRGMAEVQLLTPNFRIFIEEERALAWLESSEQPAGAPG